MNEQHLANSSLLGLHKDIGFLGEWAAKRAAPGERTWTITSQEPSGSNIKGLQRAAQEIYRKAQPVTEPIEPLSGQLAHNMAVSPKRERITVNQYGVFVPRSVFGADAEITCEKKLGVDGTISITISSQAHSNGPTTARIIEFIDRTREMRWIAEHRVEFAGQWVALDGDQLLAHGDNAREVYQAARKSGVKRPFVLQLEPADEPPFGGW